jgi:hypothetical protein
MLFKFVLYFYYQNLLCSWNHLGVLHGQWFLVFMISTFVMVYLFWLIRNVYTLLYFLEFCQPAPLPPWKNTLPYTAYHSRDTRCSTCHHHFCVMSVSKCLCSVTIWHFIPLVGFPWTPEIIDWNSMFLFLILMCDTCFTFIITFSSHGTLDNIRSNITLLGEPGTIQ